MNPEPSSADREPEGGGQRRWLPALHWQVAIALVLAGAVGALVGPQADFVAACSFLGTLFLNALKMLIVPLILASMISAMLGLGDQGVLGKLGLRTVAHEWGALKGLPLNAFMWIAGLSLLGLGARAVWAVTFA